MASRSRTLAWNVVLVGACAVVAACGGTTTGGTGTPSGGGSGGVASGGATGTGGRSSGGVVGSGGAIASGGRGAGGLTGDGGAAGSGGTSSREDRCLVDSDCTVFEDCCFCEPVAKASPPAGCLADCKVGACQEGGGTRPGAKCVTGRCVFDRTCEASTVTCNSPGPACASGAAAEIANGCFTGKCIPAEHCSSVDSCSVCQAAGLVCVRIEDFAQSVHCVKKPDNCSAPTCECMDACMGISCAVSSDGSIGCFCPNC